MNLKKYICIAVLFLSVSCSYASTGEKVSFKERLKEIINSPVFIENNSFLQSMVGLTFASLCAKVLSESIYYVTEKAGISDLSNSLAKDTVSKKIRFKIRTILSTLILAFVGYKGISKDQSFTYTKLAAIWTAFAVLMRMTCNDILTEEEENVKVAMKNFGIIVPE